MANYSAPNSRPSGREPVGSPAASRSGDPPIPTSPIVLWALVALVAVFVIIMTVGWGQMFEPVLPMLGLNYLGGCFVGVVGIIMAKAVAHERFLKLNRPESERRKLPNIWPLYFFVLILISALGTMNLFFKMVYGHETYDQAILKTEVALVNLRDRYVFSKDKPLEWAALQQSVQIERSNFLSELKNPQNPGWGAGTETHFKALQAKLPTLQRFSMKRNRLTAPEAEALAVQYDTAISDKLIAALPVSLQERKKSSEIVLVEIDSITKQLNGLRQQGAFASQSDTLRSLRSAWSFYENKVAELGDKSLPLSLRDPAAENIGRIEQIIPNLLSGAKDLRTIVIVLFALFFDWLLVQFFLRYMSEESLSTDGDPR
jgi:hypothetical protein